jgi:hypothetical protein
MVPSSAWNWIAITAVQQSSLNKKMKTKNMTILHLRESHGRSRLRLGLPRVQPIWIIRRFLLIPLALACFALSPTPNAFGVSPAPDGGYPNQNTAEGTNALFSLTTNGVRNTAIGFDALFSNTGGGANTAIGASALARNTGNNNTACGSYALANNTTGDDNNATGTDALMLNINGSDNIASGVDALFNNTSGSDNIANGDRALFSNTTGNFNTATGWRALFHNTTGDANTANGLQALNSNTIGTGNTATGFQALFSNTTGNQNAAVGEDALSGNTTGHDNIALGYGCGGNATTGSNNIDIGNKGVAGDDSTIRIGTSQSATFIAGISGTGISGTPVKINSSGQLGVVPSSSRFKDEIKPMDKASEAVLALRPVTFRYKPEVDPERAPQFGLVAEEVQKVNPALVTRDAQGKVYTVRYDAVNAMLLNEFLKEHRAVQALKSTAAKEEATITQLRQDFQSKLAEQQKQIKALTSALEKVSAQLEVNKPAPKMVGNNR